MVFSGVALRDGLLVVFSRLCLWDWLFIVFSLSGEIHIDEGSVSLNSAEELTSTDVSLSLFPRSIDIVGDNITTGPGFLGLLATGGT